MSVSGTDRTVAGGYCRHLLLLLAWLMSGGCVTSMAAGSESPTAAETQWLYADQSPRGVVVVTHGFNLDPTVMTDMEEMLQATGMDVLSLSLAGHGAHLTGEQRLRQFEEVDSFAVWQGDIDSAVAEASGRAEELDLPLYLLGFSLGGLLSADYINRSGSSVVDRAVLLAPALSLRWTSWLLRPLGVLPNFLLPNVGPDRYQANEYAPVSAYEALYSGVEQFREHVRPERINIPTLVLIDGSDELVSDGGLEAFIEEHELNRWQLRHVDKGEDAGDVLDHVIVDRNALGDAQWESLTKQIREFLTATG